MTSILETVSTEDIEEDVALHKVLLESLIESRPDAVEERDELENTIKQLQRELDRRKGVASHSSDPSPRSSSAPSSSASSPSSPVSMSFQLDGASDEPSPYDFWTNNNLSNFPENSRAHGDGLQHGFNPGPSSSLYPPLPTRKRSHLDADFSDPFETSSKRMTPNYPRSLVSTPAASPHSSDIDNDPLDDAQKADLQRLLGIDSFEEFEREQKEAEKWIREEKARQRHDAQLAFKIEQEWKSPWTFQESSSSQKPKSTTYSNDLYPFLPPTSQPTMMTDNQKAYGGSKGSANFQQNNYSNQHSNHASKSRASYSNPFNMDDDNDLTEITPQDFSRSQQQRSSAPSYTKPTYRPTTWQTDAEALREAMSRIPGNQFSASNYNSGSYMASRPGFAPYNNYNYYNQPNGTKTTMESIKAAGTQYLRQAGQSVYNSLPNGSYLNFSNPARQHLTGLTGSPWDDIVRQFVGQDDEGISYPGDSKKTIEEIKELLENIRPDTDLPNDGDEGTPEALKYTLLDHQKLGLTWMKNMEEGKNKGGILADDMGLGKTIQALALMVSRPSEDKACKTNLVVAPVALMQQWKREIKRMLHSHRQLSVWILHGDKRRVRFQDLKRHDVVLTTFGTLAAELKRKEYWEECQRHAGGNSQNINPDPNDLPVLGPNSSWYRVIIDEAQCIKNRNTKAAIACCSIKSTYRWCMSGTPMMNNLTELHSLLKFLRIRPYCALDKFNADFVRPLNKGTEKMQETALQQLRVLLKAVLLRRTKKSQINGKPILNLPPRVSEEVHAVFSQDEDEFYKALETRSALQVNRYLNAGTSGRHYSNILVLLLRLRQACCHPHLIKDFAVDLNAATSDIDLIANAKLFSAEVIIRLKENEPLECPVCMDAVDNPIIFFPCGHSTCTECFARISDPSIAVQQGHDGLVEVKCPNCRAKVDPKKVTDHHTFKKVHFPTDGDSLDDSDPTATETSERSDESKEDDVSDDDSSDEDDDSDERGSLTDFIEDDEDDSELSKNKKNKKKSKKSKGKEPKKPEKTLAVLKKEALRNAKAKRKYLRRLEETWVSSAKIDKTMEVLHKIRDEGKGEKTIIFSQFTSLLDLLEIPINREGWHYRRYDGSMRPGDRNDAVVEFTDNPQCRIMLVSLKAGNAGLNLVAASRVIIFDPFWNPYVEEQAIDRAHRIGQMRPVHIHRILVQGSVEDRILELQDKKRALIEGALDENAAKSVSRLSTRELKFLFNIK